MSRESADVASAAAHALRPALVASEQVDADVIDVVENALAEVHLHQDAWTLREGARLRFVRSGLLRLIKPFSDSQDSLNVALSAAAMLLADEVVSLRRQVEDLRRRVDEGTSST